MLGAGQDLFGEMDGDKLAWGVAGCFIFCHLQSFVMKLSGHMFI
jgi:hypothetical protein